MKEGERGPFFPKLRVRIKDNNSSPHGKFYRFLFPFSSKFSDLNFASYVLYIYLHTVNLGDLWLQLMVEEDWLKMLRKRKFWELKTADEEKALCKINTICQKLVFYFCTMAKCNAEQISS